MDIECKEDIHKIVKLFYEKLMKDGEMEHFFVDFRNPIYLEKHLIVLVDFWDNILFFSGAYKKNAMRPHLDLQSQKPFKKKHFKRWLFHFNNSVDEFFHGEMAHTAKTRALSIATVMEMKIIEMTK